jgi:hypothetical protein
MKLGKVFFFIVFVLLISGCFVYQNYISPATVMVTSVSSDGHYAVTSDIGKRIILWDLQRKRIHYISYNANIYSAYFIKNTHVFLWQDLNNIAHLETVHGKQLLKFKNFPTYGEVMTSDLKHYIASDSNWTVYENYGANQRIIKNDYKNEYFYGFEKLFNLTLSDDNKYLLTSGATANDDYDKLPLSVGMDAHAAGIVRSDLGNFSLLDGVTLWNAETGKPIDKLPGTLGKSFATISLDAKYILSGDEGSGGYVWNAQTGKRLLDLDSLTFGHPVDPKNVWGKWDKKGLIPVPNDFVDYDTGYASSAILSLKFIDNQNYYLRFTTYIPYAILYSVTNPQPLKYIYLGKNPMPSVSDYTRDESIDTSPVAHILVTGQDSHSGIIVYRYDPKTETLTKIWAPQA